MKKIFCYINGGNGTDWNNVVALCEDGHCLAQHISSNEWFARYDIGINSYLKHDQYKKYCPEGYELVWVDDPATNEDLAAAYAKNQELAKLAESSQQETTAR